ncbi:MAG: hypothetical protein CMP31_11400 [Roseibacillus sp.]|nr:hypothetical protein [Roseibacillus sp.]
MPETRHLLQSISLSRAIAAIPLFLALPGCHLFVAQPAVPPRDLASPPLPVRSNHPTPHAPGPRTERLHFRVDSSASTALISLTLDPMALASRRSTCSCPLKGTVTGTLNTSGLGTRTFTIEKIDLATAGDGRLEFDWTPLIGAIRILIPAGILTIRDHTMPRAMPLQQDGRFSHSKCRFRVGGTCQVQGSGLVLRKKVGQTEKDLTVARTEPVVLAGSLTHRENRWILDIPSAVMKDRFEVDEEGTILDLIFTGSITAVEK